MPYPFTPLYGQITGGYLECPTCQRIIAWGRGRRHQREYNRSLGTIHCPFCQRTFVIGMLVWDATGGPAVARPGTRMTTRQLAEARSYNRAFWANVEPNNAIPTNAYIPEGCSCYPEGWKASCPVHRLRNAEQVRVETRREDDVPLRGVPREKWEKKPKEE